MTSRPELARDVNYVNGLAAVALFGVMAFVFLTAELPAPRGFGEGSITATIGYSMFDALELIPEGHGETEGFLIAFLVIAVVLDAALDGALMLARREEDESVVTALTDGGRRAFGRSDADDASTSGDSTRTTGDGVGRESEAGRAAGGGEN